MLNVELVGWVDQSAPVKAEAMNDRLTAVERKLLDLEHEVLDVAEQALRAPEPAEIREGALVWDRLTAEPLIAVVETIVEVHEADARAGARAHRVVGWIVRDERGSYGARAAAEITTVRPAPKARRGRWPLRLLVGSVVVAVTMLLMLASTGR